METFDELYYREPYLREFEAQVTSCAVAEGGFEVILSQTAFYPLGGGQPGDRGTLTLGEGDETVVAHVLDTRRVNDEVIHLTDAPLPVGADVTGTLEWTWRLDNMEAHTGEHIVSGIVHALFGYENVGFHMGSKFVEIDFDGLLDDEQVADVERRANAVVRTDLAVSELIPAHDELASLDYRSKKELEGLVRLVSIPGVDLCACCGVHVATTGQVGLIKVMQATTKKKRTRLELLCGRRAFEACRDGMARLRDMSNFLSTSDDDAPQAVRRLSAEKDRLKHELRQARRRLIDASLDKEPASQRLMVRREDGLDVDELRYLCEQALERCLAEVVAALSPTADDPARLAYVIASGNVDLRPVCRQLNARLGGRGGGKPGMVQGSFVATPGSAEAALRELL